MALTRKQKHKKFAPNKIGHLWTYTDDQVSLREGWGIFYCNALDHDPWELSALDDPHGVAADSGEEFKGIHFEGPKRDYAAAEYVQKRADEGNPLARKAIEFLLAVESTDIKEFGLQKTW